MKFEAEVALLVGAITLFVVSTFFYSYQAASLGLGLNYPLRVYAITFVGFGSALMATASIS